jgi:hypothetical protein
MTIIIANNNKNLQAERLNGTEWRPHFLGTRAEDERRRRLKHASTTIIKHLISPAFV